MNPPSSLAVLKMSALGDVVFTLPLVSVLREVFPDTLVTWVIGSSAYPLVQHMKGVRWCVVEKPSGLKNFLEMRKKVSAEYVDTVLCLQTSVRASIVLACMRARCTVGFDVARNREGQTWLLDETVEPRKNHLVDSFMQHAEHLGVKDPVVCWELPLGDEAESFLYGWRCNNPQPYMVLHPASSDTEKNASVDVYASFVGHVLEHTDMDVVITGGPFDPIQPLLESIHRYDGFKDRVKVYARETSLDVLRMAALLKEARCVVAPDTGALHIARALGTKVLGLYGVTNPEHSGPYGRLDCVVNVYPQVCEEHRLLPKWGARLRVPGAMNRISTERVWEAFLRVCAS